ncbi:XcbB/CpsF family capsular polysaccharide biosynthesis protein [Actinobacillus vicugnae]|uniref:XcbB/CpsF family capsular polysaccharide biosynthesis protein n=1 Tax=Actinobacillus vicugnae TaxID=2573093 RepID=UPI0012425617|nr:XcbB/CpsF family capsular polysaccharide biosynthesis protein [Actinobacillus vicugnae]
MLDFFKIEFNENTKYEELDIDFTAKEIYINKSSIGKDEKEKLNYNFLAVGRSNVEAKKLIADLSNNRYFLTNHTNGISLFTKFIDGKSFLPHFNDKNVQVWNDTFYTLEEPQAKDNNNRLLIIFSSIADLAFNASVSRRMFFKNFPSISKYIPKNTYILRIADIGGVLGGFYSNSNADMMFEEKIQKLICKIKRDYLIKDDNIVLYGTSKGATGALLHGIKLGLKTISVDPIVSDEYYIEKHNDLHFVTDVFPMSKQEKFIKILKEESHKNLSNIKLITSPNSEQFKYINKILLASNLGICSYIFTNPQIKGHTYIGEQTLNFVTSMLNNLLYNIDIKDSFVSNY